MFSNLVKRVSDAFSSLRSDKEVGQGLIEYGLIIALISIACIAVLILFGPQLTALFSQALSGLQAA